MVSSELYKADEKTLVSLCKQGNTRAFEVLLYRTKNRVFTTIFLIVKDRYESEDLLQDTYAKAYNELMAGRFNNDGKMQNWLCRIAHNLCIDFVRKKKIKPKIVWECGGEVLTSIEVLEKSYEERATEAIVQKKLHKLLDLLKPELRETIVLRHFVGLSFAEISALQGVNLNTCLGRMRYALLKLREIMEINAIEIR